VQDGRRDANLQCRPRTCACLRKFSRLESCIHMWYDVYNSMALGMIVQRASSYDSNREQSERN
jgi:hypothetical protein